MKNRICFLLFLAIFLVSCGASKNNNSTSNNNKMEFTVTHIKNEMDGQTISLKDDKGGDYITVISIPNGNFVDLKVGNRIQLTAEEIMESDPAQIISKDIKVIGGGDSIGEIYEKEEEENYWVHARKTTANDMMGNPIECLQLQKGTTLDKDGEWLVICDPIEDFLYQEGKYYQIKVLKKWLKNHEMIADRSPYDLELVTVVSREIDPTYVNPIKTIVSTNKKVYTSGEPILLGFEVKNTSTKPFTFLPWKTPIEDRMTGGFMNITHNGKPVRYAGIMVKRMPPTEKDYVTIESGKSVSGEIDLLEGYDLKSAGKYSLQFKEMYDGLPASNVVEIEVK